MAFWGTLQYNRSRLASMKGGLTRYDEGRNLLEHLIHREGLILRRCGRCIGPHDQG